MAVHFTYRHTGQFAPLVCDLVEGDEALQEAFAHPFTRAGLEQAAATREFPAEARELLCRVLDRQYSGLPLHHAVRANLDRLRDQGTLTVTTGHQLCLFTGPLYFPIKIMNAVRLARDLSTPQRVVVPVFWMASEDHDRAEIDHAWLDGRKVQWPGEAGPPVGRMRLDGIGTVVEEACSLLGEGLVTAELRDLLRAAYQPGFTLAQATRQLVNGLFGRYGVVVIDGDDPDLKRAFVPCMKRELVEGITMEGVRTAAERQSGKYGAQAHARPINLFHIGDRSRARIEQRDGKFEAVDGFAGLSVEELSSTLEAKPEAFSPNVLLRPIYQETVLPNVAYVGGGAEVAYWSQLKPVFHAFGVPMPVVALRTSVIVMALRDRERLAQMGLQPGDMFAPIDELRGRVARSGSAIDLDLGAERAELGALFDRLAGRAKQVDPTLEASVKGEAQKAHRSLDHIEQKLLRAAKRDQEQALARLDQVHQRLFPGGALAERRDNVLPLLARHGINFLDRLMELDALDKTVAVIDV